MSIILKYFLFYFDLSNLKVNDLEEPPEALDMSWPKTGKQRIWYLLVAPIVVPLWLTLPDTRRQSKRKYFPVTFIGSIMWIAAYSYFMVWWANVAGETVEIPPEVKMKKIIIIFLFFHFIFLLFNFRLWA